MTVNLTTNATLIKEKLPVLLEYPVHQINVSLHSADDNDCIDMDSYIHNLFESCETLLDKTETEISLRLWNTKKEPFLDVYKRQAVHSANLFLISKSFLNHSI